jgi:hypothetical protein
LLACSSGIAPIADSAPLSAKLLKNSTLNIYETFPHGMCTTHADVVNPDFTLSSRHSADPLTTGQSWDRPA